MFSDNALMTGDPNIRFYAGYPLNTSSGHCLGTLCAIDSKPRSLTQEQSEILKYLSNYVATLLELRKQVNVSKPTPQLVQFALIASQNLDETIILIKKY
jgi:GAF domain-containing protein